MQPFAAPVVGSPQWWKQPERYALTGDPDQDTARIVGLMCRHIKKGADDPAVQHYAEEAARQFAGIAAVDGDAALPACAWWWCKTYIKFVHHEKLLRRHLGEAGHLQGLISPDSLVRIDRPEGDCAIFTDCLLAFLAAYGVPYELVTVKVDPREPFEYSHVYSYAVLPDGRRFPLDASHGDYPGWQVPTRDILYAENEGRSPALQVWDANGNRVPDRGSRFDGLHGYGLRGRGFGALVCLDPNDTSSCYEDGTGPGPTTTLPIGGNPLGSGPCVCTFGFESCCTPSSGGASSGPVYTVPPQSTAAYAALAQQLIKGGFTLAELNNLQPGTVINPNGQIVRQAPGYAVTTGGTVAASSLLSSGTSLTPWLIGAAVIGLGLAFGARH